MSQEPRVRRRRTAALLVLALAGGGLALWLSGWGPFGRSNENPRQLKLYGNVDIRQVDLGFRVSGRLKSMAFDEGQLVTAGTELASLDARPFNDEVRLAEAQVAEAEATLLKLQRGSRRQEVAGAQAAVAEAAATYENARTSLKRAQQLFADRAVSPATLDDAEAAAHVAEARLKSAQERLDLVVAGSRSEDVAAGQAALSGAQARLASARTALEDARLIAPSDGVVLSRVREPGAIVSPTEAVYVLSLPRPIAVRAYVGEAQLGKVRPGTEVTVHSDSAPSQPFRGRIGFVSPTAEFTPKSVETAELRTELVYRLRILVDEPAPGLLQGMPVTVQVSTEPSLPLGSSPR